MPSWPMCRSCCTPTTTTGGTTGALSGTVGPGFDISMDKKTVPAGAYVLTLDCAEDAMAFVANGYVVSPGAYNIKAYGKVIRDAGIKGE